MKDYEKDILKCLNESCEANEASDQFTGLNESCEANEASDQFTGLRETLADVEKQFGVVLDTDIDSNGEGEFFWFDTNYNRNTFETESEANEFEDKFQEEFGKWCRANGYECDRSEDAPLSFWIRKKSVNEDNDEKKLNWQDVQPILEKLFDGEIAFNYVHDKDGTLEFKAESWLELPSEFQIEDEIEEKLGVMTSVEYDKYNENGVIDDEGETISIFITPRNSEKINESRVDTTEEERKILTDKQEEIKSILEDKFKGHVVFDFGYQDAGTEFLVSLNENNPTKLEIEEAIKEKTGLDVKVTYLHEDKNKKDNNKVLTVCIDFPDKDVDHWEMFISHDGTNCAGNIAGFYDLDRAKRACKYYNKHSKHYNGKFVLVDKDGKIIFDKDGDRQ